MPRREVTIARDADAVARLVRILDASVNVRALAALIAERKAAPRKDGGWLFLSDLAKRLGEAPGTVSTAVQKLVPDLVEEKYEKGRRYFRSRVTSLAIAVDEA